MKKRPVIKNNILDDEIDAVCATETTGLIPFSPEDEYELNSYKEIVNFSADKINIYKEPDRR